ncbi:unnamed protein product [Arctogadus glacialis]
MGSTVMESNKDGSKKIPKKRRSLRIDMPGELPVCTSCPTRGIFQRSSSVSPPSCPGSAPVLTKVSPGSPKTIFPYPSQQQGSSSPKSPRRLSFSGMFRSSSGSSSSSIKLFSRARKVNTGASVSVASVLKREEDLLEQERSFIAVKS